MGTHKKRETNGSRLAVYFRVETNSRNIQPERLRFLFGLSSSLRTKTQAGQCLLP